MANTILYLKGNKGELRFWRIESVSDGFNTEWGHVGSPNTQEEFTPIPYGKANRTQFEQIHNEVAAKIKKRIERGYSRTVEEAESKNGRGPNELGLPRSMQAIQLKNTDADFSDYFHQPKLDGHRCLIAASRAEPIAYSRNGKEIPAIVEILDELRCLRGMISGVLDGELYAHGHTLQEIGSWAKRRQDATMKLEYWVYDIVKTEMPFYRRFYILRHLFDAINFNRVKLCPTIRGVAEAPRTLSEYRSKGFEGGILRDPNGLYEPGKRSKGLVKLKQTLDDEFIVDGITASAAGWAILRCRTRFGTIFTVSAPGDNAEKKYVLDNPGGFIGQSIRVEFAFYTADKKPFHPVAREWRNKSEE